MYLLFHHHHHLHHCYLYHLQATSTTILAHKHVKELIYGSFYAQTYMKYLTEQEFLALTKLTYIRKIIFPKECCIRVGRMAAIGSCCREESWRRARVCSKLKTRSSSSSSSSSIREMREGNQPPEEEASGNGVFVCVIVRWHQLTSTKLRITTRKRGCWRKYTKYWIWCGGEAKGFWVKWVI